MNNIWSFPMNQDDSQTGISDSGIETFREDMYSSLARETCQNSMDAKLKGQEYAKVVFILSYIDQSKLQNVHALVDAFAKSKKYGEALHDTKTIDFFAKKLQVLSGKLKGFMLKISLRKYCVR